MTREFNGGRGESVVATERRRSGSVEPIGGGEDVKQEALAAGAEAARTRKRRPGGGRKRKRPDYDAGRNLEELMDAAVELYDAGQSLQAIADELALNPIKVRKLLITAEVYESEIAEEVRATFEAYRARQDYRAAVQATAEELRLSIPSVNSYLPYEKGVYFAATDSVEKISAGAERQRRYRAMKKWRAAPTEENLWGVVQAYAGAQFKTWSGLGFSYQLRRGRNGEFTRELWIDRREQSKSLAWSSVMLALGKVSGTKKSAELGGMSDSGQQAMLELGKVPDGRNSAELGVMSDFGKQEPQPQKTTVPVIQRPKDLGDIRGISYIYAMFYRFGIIDVPEKVKAKMGR